MWVPLCVQRFHQIAVRLPCDLVAHMDSIVCIEHPVHTHEDAAVGLSAFSRSAQSSVNSRPSLAQNFGFEVVNLSSAEQRT